MDAPKAMACISDVEKFMQDAKFPMNVMWSYKLDGVRVMAVVHSNGEVDYHSRNGKKFENFHKFDGPLRDAAKKMFDEPKNGVYYPVIFDGEMMPKSGNGDSLAKVMTQLRRLKDVDDSLFQYCVFDFIPSGVEPLVLSWTNPTQLRRYQTISGAIGDDGIGDVVYHRHYFGPECFGNIGEVDNLMKHALKEGYEGIVLKAANGTYEQGKRSTKWCKVKPSDTMDLKVVDYTPGGGKHANRLGALVCEMPDGQIVSVGSGFDDSERYEFAHFDGREWVKNLPTMIEVGYQELTKAGVLRFPTFKQVREDK